MNKRYISNIEYQKLVANICRDIAVSNWRPDYVVGITRGGLIPAVMISHYLNVPMHTLKVSMRDDKGDCESNLWMSEDAFGYIDTINQNDDTKNFDVSLAKNILIVDDINDSGLTLNWIVEDWKSSCLPNDARWDSVWNHNVRFAVVFDNTASKFSYSADFVGEEITKKETDWLVFPYENWWN
jgi:xanthine phosphoribosyltransferase